MCINLIACREFIVVLYLNLALPFLFCHVALTTKRYQLKPGLLQQIILMKSDMYIHIKT